jgi:hypothetical protein
MCNVVVSYNSCYDKNKYIAIYNLYDHNFTEIVAIRKLNEDKFAVAFRVVSLLSAYGFAYADFSFWYDRVVRCFPLCR